MVGRGPRTPKKAKNFTRWTAIYDCSHAQIELNPHMISAWSKQWEDPVEKENKDRHVLVKGFLNVWCSYKNIVHLVIMRKCGEYLVAVHKKFQQRSADFMFEEREIKALKQNINSLLEEDELKMLVEEVETCIEKCSKVPNIKEIQKDADCEVFLHHASPKFIRDYLYENASKVVEVFSEDIEKYFPDNTLEFLGGFSIFDPMRFPDTVVIQEKKEREEMIEQYGKHQLNLFSSFYGTPRKFIVGPKEGQMAVPVINKDLLSKQWRKFKIYFQDIV